MKIFVVHYKKLVDRKKHVLDQFQKYNITNYEFVEIDRDELNGQPIHIFKKNYSTSQIAIFLSHFYAYQQISKYYNCGLIFEDDIILSDNFTNILKKYMNDLPTNYDMLFIGDGCNLHIETDEIVLNKNIYEKQLNPKNWDGKRDILPYEGATRCCDSYLVSNKCATQICNYISTLHYKIDIPIDWWLNIAARDNNLKIYWSEPTIVTQGTQNGLFQSSH
jgi:glycosyl transferase family 25